MAELFGWELKKKSTKKKEHDGSIVPPNNSDGAYVYDKMEGGLGTGGTYSFTQSFDAIQKSDRENINYYRTMAENGEMDSLIDEIITEALTFEAGTKPVELYISDESEVSEDMMNKFKEEFDNILSLLDFYKKGDEIFRRWYIDGRLFYHKIVDKKNLKNGVKQLRWIDPRNIKKVQEIEKEKQPETGVEVIKNVDEYYVYSKRGSSPGEPMLQDVKIAPEAITYVTSGLLDKSGHQVLSYLHKAIKPFNQLNMLEDAVVIYRLARAPERRVFYVDTFNLPKTRAEQYMKEVMAQHRNKLVYNASTGSVDDRKEQQSMLEDIWLPRKEGSRGTEVETLQSGQQLGELDDVIYFEKKLYKALHIPLSRLAEEQSAVDFGRSSEITRDEIKFSRFIEKLRGQFANLFLDLLKTQLVLKNIINENEWPEYKEYLSVHFNSDSIFVENKETEIMDQRLNKLNQVDEHLGKYFSKEHIMKTYLKLSEEEIEEMKKQIKQEKSDGEINDDEESGGGFSNFR